MSEDFSNRGTGYLIEQENHEFLLSTSQPASLFTFGDINPVNLGDPIGMIDITIIEDQKQQGSCAGHAGTTSAETCIYHAGGGQIQLCREFAYINGQRKTGLSGDVGATLEGVIRGFNEDGCPREEYWPYSGQYEPRIPAEAMKHAGEFKLNSWSPIRELQEAYEALARRVGALFLGIPCTQEIFDSPADGRLEHYTPQRAGGHAMAIVDWCKERDENGYPYFLLANSWGRRYGYNGFRKVRPSALVNMMRTQNSSFYLLSEMKFLKPRYDWKSNKWLA